MINTKQLLGQLLGGATSSGGGRLQHALGDQGLRRSDSPLSGLLSGLTGGSGGASGQPSTGGQSGGMLGQLSNVASQIFGSTKQGVRDNNPAVVGGLGAAAGAIFGGGMKGALGGGALALLGSLAYSALNPKPDGSDATPEELEQNAPLGVREPKDAAEEAELERHADIILKAMIAAAKADGEISAAERQRILGHLQENGADQEARAYVEGEMQKPVELSTITSQVQSQELAAEVYAASLLAIEVDSEAERNHLRALAYSMNLPQDAVHRLHNQLGVARF